MRGHPGLLVEEYDITLSPISIVLRAAEAYADEIERRRHDDATIAHGENIRAAVAQLRAPVTIDVELLRAQRDWMLSLQADTPAALALLVKAGGEYVDGVVNVLDAILDSVEGYATPLEWAGETGQQTGDEDLAKHWIGRRVRNQDGHEFTASAISEKHDKTILSDGVQWAYLRNITPVESETQADSPRCQDIHP